MAATAPITLTDAPAAPDRSDRSTFSARAIAQDLFVKNVNIPELRLLMANVYGNAVDAYNNTLAAGTSAGNAAASEAAAASSATLAAGNASAPVWVAKNYTQGDRVSSTLNGRLFRRTTAGTTASATDPSADTGNWAVISNGFAFFPPVAGAAVTAQAGWIYSLTGALCTATAPAAPLPGDTFQVAICNALTTNVMNWNGLKHENLSDATMTMDMVRVWTFTYISTAYGWRVY